MGNPMDANAQRVLEESRRFRAALPELLPQYNGRWVVFRNGAVVDAFDDEDDAYVAAVDKFGVGGGFVIARVGVNALEPVAVSAALFFTR
jgi:hypothetical protein